MITRGVTYSDYDHVAMVLKFEGDSNEKDDVYIIDATLDGVNVTSWETVWGYKDIIYKKIVWRRLFIKRDDIFISRLTSFVQSVNKKKYSLSVTKLLKR